MRYIKLVIILYLLMVGLMVVEIVTRPKQQKEVKETTLSPEKQAKIDELIFNMAMPLNWLYNKSYNISGG